jgi:hypothetical protein
MGVADLGAIQANANCFDICQGTGNVQSAYAEPVDRPDHLDAEP